MKKFTPVEALRLLATTELKPFDKGDWETFSGAMAKEPLIAYPNDDFYILLDENFEGKSILVIGPLGEETPVNQAQEFVLSAIKYPG